jgi:hypothetical protein
MQPPQLHGENAGLIPDLTKQRLLREYEATTARYGTTIDDLAPYVVQRAAG